MSHGYKHGSKELAGNLASVVLPTLFDFNFSSIPVTRGNANPSPRENFPLQKKEIPSWVCGLVVQSWVEPAYWLMVVATTKKQRYRYTCGKHGLVWYACYLILGMGSVKES